MCFDKFADESPGDWVRDRAVVVSQRIGQANGIVRMSVLVITAENMSSYLLLDG